MSSAAARAAAARVAAATMIVADPAPLTDFVAAAAEALDVPPPRRAMPRPLAFATAVALEAVGALTGRPVPLTRARVRALVESHRVPIDAHRGRPRLVARGRLPRRAEAHRGCIPGGWQAPGLRRERASDQRLGRHVVQSRDESRDAVAEDPVYLQRVAAAGGLTQFLDRVIERRAIELVVDFDDAEHVGPASRLDAAVRFPQLLVQLLARPQAGEDDRNVVVDKPERRIRSRARSTILTGSPMSSTNSSPPRPTPPACSTR